MRIHNASGGRVVAAVTLAACALAPLAALSQVRDPGVRKTAADGGTPQALPGLSAEQMLFFQSGLQHFSETESVSDEGLGPRFNSDSCVSCHSQPFAGGSSPAANPLFSIANAQGASNQMPWFITKTGPVREARFVTSNGVADGGVHDLFTVTGRADAGSCSIAQPSFGTPGNPLTGQGGNRNVVFRIPTPTFGAGLIEAIPDSVILANHQANTSTKQRFGVGGHPNAIIGGAVNRSANDGTLTRFGWKAQNKSLLMFAGEAYNVEMGVSNELFPQERDETANCQGGRAPNDQMNIPNPADPPSATAVLSDLELFAMFMRMLAPPVPAAPNAITQRGSAVFASVGCALCHTPSLASGPRPTGGLPIPAVANQQVPLFSDLLVHHMGTGLADGITQGAAGPDEFRTAPLWGLGQRVFFLHDGRSTDLIQTIRAHASSGSEANQVVLNYFSLNPADQQALINFLRSL
jgi:CxxC motif-containing protein (DUF1111 family)